MGFGVFFFFFRRSTDNRSRRGARVRAQQWPAPLRPRVAALLAGRAWISYISDGFRMKRCADAKWSGILDTEWSFLHVFSKFAIFVFHLFFFSASTLMSGRRPAHNVA